jgi:hypothetical protein
MKPTEKQMAYLKDLEEGSKFNMLYKKLFPLPPETKDEASVRIGILVYGNWERIEAFTDRKTVEAFVKAEGFDLYCDGYTEKSWTHAKSFMLGRAARRIDEKYTYWNAGGEGPKRLHTVIDKEIVDRKRAENAEAQAKRIAAFNAKDPAVYPKWLQARNAKRAMENGAEE